MFILQPLEYIDNLGTGALAIHSPRLCSYCDCHFSPDDCCAAPAHHGDVPDGIRGRVHHGGPIIPPAGNRQNIWIWNFIIYLVRLF